VSPSADTARLAGAKVLVIGDIMLDRYQHGVVERISPEAPVPVVRVVNQDFKIGGAGNVAQNAALLDGSPTLVSVCGADGHGDELERLCRALYIDARLIHSTSRETTLKTRIMAAHQQMLRVDRETTLPLDAGESAALRRTVDGLVDGFEIIVLSDYGKGVVSAEFLTWLHERAAGRKIILDPKTCNFPHYRNLYCMTPNAKEASEGAGLPVAGREDIIRAGKHIVERHRLESLVITLGADGMAVFLPGQGVFHLPTTAQKVFDVTGAGDTVIAVIALALSSGFDLLDSCVLANCAAGLVVGQVGAAAVSREELESELASSSVRKYQRWADF